jgi:hypothetical protein
MTARGPTWLALALTLSLFVPSPLVLAQGTPVPGDAGTPAKAPEGETAATPAPTLPQAAPAPAPLAPTPSAQPTGWHTVTGPDNTFTAELPAPPKYTSSRVATGTGSLYTVHQYLLEQGDVAYIVQTAVYPDDINVTNPRLNLQGGLDNLAKDMEGAKWGSVDWLTHQGLTASDAIGAKNGHAIRSFSVMKGRQVFMLIYAGTPGTARSADVNRFVASLRVGP